MVQGQGRQPNAGGSDRAGGVGGGARVSVSRGGAEECGWIGTGEVEERAEKFLCGAHLSVRGRNFYVGPTCQSEGGNFVWALLFSRGERGGDEGVQAWAWCVPGNEYCPQCALHFILQVVWIFS
ncbi:hypothetical protein DAI22_10g092801 [Oryza sativa Japonica Group]|nr:hypothetical protein DAI22_10g092801 [Oryza sativa Japonica Group]